MLHVPAHKYAGDPPSGPASAREPLPLVVVYFADFSGGKVKCEPAPILEPSGRAGVRSFAVEVVADSGGKFCGNAVRYPSFESAKAGAIDLAGRWTLVRAFRVIESADAPNRGVA